LDQPFFEMGIGSQGGIDPKKQYWSTDGAEEALKSAHGLFLENQYLCIY
jgi:hypothetical protein